jgi:hypothetical protein
MCTAIMEIFALIAHLLTSVVRVAPPGGVRAVIAESLLLKHQLLVLSRSRTELRDSRRGIGDCSVSVPSWSLPSASRFSWQAHCHGLFHTPVAA